MTGRPRAVSLAMLAALTLAVVWASPARIALANWTFGPEYLVRVEKYEYQNGWYWRHVYWRPAYFNGVYRFEEFVRNVDVFQGSILAYGAPVEAGQTVEYCNPPHASLVTRYHRPVYRYGQLAGYEPLPGMTRIEDACTQYEGQAFAEDAQVVMAGGVTMLKVTYSYPIYHSNPAYGTFIVGYGQRQELTPVAGTTSGPGTAAPVPAQSNTPYHAAAYLDIALRQLDSVEGFDDFALVASSTYAQDIKEAFELGLIVGKYDETRRYFDPNAAITTGEMLNILARNLGASPAVQGAGAAAYLAGLGVSVPTALDGALTMSTLESLARQISVLDQVPKADLLVVRQVLEGTLVADLEGSITRAYAVAMYRPGTASGPGTTAPLPTAAAGGQTTWDASSPVPAAQLPGPETPVWPPVPQPPPGPPPETLQPKALARPQLPDVLFVLSD